MYNEITRKLTSLTLMAVMVAGGLTFAVPGMEPAYAANDKLTVSAEAVGNFAGIQVIEIVVNDPERSDTGEANGVPNVEINGLDVLMNQGSDGAWYAYVANQLAINESSNTEVSDTFYHATGIDITPIGGDAKTIFNGTGSFLKGFQPLSGLAGNHPDVTTVEWPIIQTFEISDNTQVNITYGSGINGESVSLTYDYDDSKDLTLDRNRYPASAGIIVSLDDSLLNLSPTADDYWAFNSTKVYYILEDDLAVDSTNEVTWLNVGFEEGPLNYNFGSNIFSIQNTTIHDVIHEDNPGVDNDFVILSESDIDANVFVNYDSNDNPNLVANSDNQKTGSGTIEYNNNHSIILDTFNAVIKFINNVDEWLSGVEIELELIDEDKNLNSAVDEDMLIVDGEVPYIKIGEPIHFGSATIIVGNTTNVDGPITNSQIYTVINDADTFITINGTWPYPVESDEEHVFSYVNLDFTDLGNSNAKGTFYMGSPDDTIDNGATPSGVTFATDDTNPLNPTYEVVINGLTAGATGNVYFDILSFGQLLSVADPATGDINDNVERINDAFYRFELEETDDNTAKFTGSVEYLMINQLNYNDVDTYDSIETADDNIVIIVNDDMDGVDAIRVSYNDVISTGNEQIISVQEDANTHTGTISFDKTSYSSGNTITVTLNDVDLNTDSDTPQIYTISNLANWVGNKDVWLTQLTFNDELYHGCVDNQDVGLNSTSFSLIETAKASGIFEGTLQLPTLYCDDGPLVNSTATTNGVDIEFEYQDYSDASGNPNESSTKAAVSSNTGSVSLDKTVYGVPFDANDFPLHPTAVGENHLPATGTTITIQVNDPDHNAAANGEDSFSADKVKLFIKRGSDSTGNLLANVTDSFVEIDPQSGIFELDFEIAQRSDTTLSLSNNGAINQGDIISVQYTDENDASGKLNTVTDSATFDLRNGVLQSDKSEYIIGTDAIITLIEPDLNMDSDTEETLSLDLIEWDSDAGTTTLADPVFDAQPAGLRETGPDTGIFQVIIEIPQEVDSGDKLERGEDIDLEYIDQGPAGADFVGEEDEDITTTIRTSDFGASIELDQKVYTWTDKVYVTIVAPDHNFDSNSIDEIGGDDKIVQVYTRSDKIRDYKFVESGPDTGIFTGEIILTGFTHDADGDGDVDINNPTSSGTGPTDGLLPAGDDDGITVTFEYSDNKVAQGSSLIRWNIGEVQFLEASYPAKGSGVVRVIDPDMNLNPESVDSFDINVWSDSAAGGISLSMTETNESTGIFEGSIIFTTTDASSGSRLRVAEGDTVTAEYEDNTLPDPYSTADELDVTATTLIGTVVPPLERAPAGNLRAVDAFGNSLDTVSVDQQIQVTADLSNNQDRVQQFAYLLQVQDGNGVTVSLSWLTGELQPDQQLSPAVSWIPEELGDYTATVFVWESIDNPTALSPPSTTVVKVNS